MRKSILLVAPLLLLSAIAMAAQKRPTATSVLTAYKAASGGTAWNNIHSIQRLGSMQILGLEGPAQRLTNLETGASLIHIQLSLGTMTLGNDGTAKWTKTMGGGIKSWDLPIEHARALTHAYLNAKGYWYPQRWPAKTKFLGTRSAEDQTYQVVRITPKDGTPATLWFNAKTHLLARQIEQISVGTGVTTFSDYRTVDGVKISFQSHRSAWDNDTQMYTRKIKVNVTASSKLFAKPVQTIDDVTFADGTASVTMPFTLLPGSHIGIQASLNGHPISIILDSGAWNTILPTVAKSLDLKTQGSSKTHGFGAKAVKTRWARVKTLTLGNQVTLHHQVFRVLPLGNIKKVAPQISGIAGYEIFKRFVVRIDYAHRKLTLIKPSTFQSKGAGKAISIAFTGWGTLPAVMGSLDGLKDWFTVDTGSGAPLLMFTPFVKQHDLLSRYKAGSSISTGGGIGGGLSVRPIHPDVFMFGPFAIKLPLALLATSRQGALAFKDAAGNIGGPILKHFTVTFDYTHKRIYLKPNATFHAHQTIDLPVAALKKFVGRYQLKPHVFITISRAGDQLRLQVTGQPTIPIYPTSKTSFLLKVVDATIDFEVNAGNQVTALVLHQAGRSFTCKRIMPGK